MKKLMSICLVVVLFTFGMTVYAEQSQSEKIMNEIIMLKAKYYAGNVTEEEKVNLMKQIETLAAQWQAMQPITQPPLPDDPKPTPPPLPNTQDEVMKKLLEQISTFKMLVASSNLTEQEKQGFYQQIILMNEQLLSLQNIYNITWKPQPVNLSQTNVPTKIDTTQQYRLAIDKLQRLLFDPNVSEEDKLLAKKEMTRLEEILNKLGATPADMQTPDPLIAPINEMLMLKKMLDDPAINDVVNKVQGVTPSNSGSNITTKTISPTVSIAGSKVYVDQKLVPLRMTPVIMNGQTMVQAKPLLESMGYKVSWVASSKTMNAVHRSGVKLGITATGVKISDKGKSKTVAMKSAIIKGTQMIPIKMLSGQLGYQFQMKK